MVDILEFKKKGIIQRKVILTNKKTGEIRTYLLRAFLPGDEEGMIACVKEEHKNSYFKKFFYDPVLLRKKAEGEEYIFFVAEEVTESEEADGCKNQIAGIELLRIFKEHGDDYIEPASQMIRKSHRGYGLSGALVDYTYEVAISLKPAALFSHVAMYHTITQHVCEAYGMIPVGYEIGSFLTEVMENSFVMKRIKKYSAGTLCYPVEHTKPVTVYLPTELADYGTSIYEKLNVPYHIVTEKNVANITDNAGVSKVPEESEIIISRENEINRYITIDVKKVGDDFYEKIGDLLDEHIRNGKNPDGWVYHLMLDIDTPEFIEQYHRLKDMGFFLGSLQPLCGVHERAFLYMVGNLELHMEDYEVTEQFDVIRSHINEFYKNRKQ